MGWRRSRSCYGDGKKKESGEGVSSDKEPFKVETSSDNPGFVFLETSVFEEDGKTHAKQIRECGLEFRGGAGIAAETLQRLPEPKGSDEFWERQRAKLKDVPMNPTITEIPSKRADFKVYDVKLDCPGGKPVSGILVKPANGKEKSLPAMGPLGAGPDFQKGKITFNVNAHGIENGRESD